MPKDRGKKTLRLIFAALFWVAVWEAAALLVSNSLLFPTPVEVCGKLIELAGHGSFWQSIVFSLLRVLAGFALGCAFGILLAAATVRVPFLNTLFSPLMSMLKAVPVASFIMLVILIFKRDVLPVFICFIMVLPIVWSAVSLALNTVPEEYTELARAYRLKRWRKLLRLYIPWTMPHLAQSMITALGFAWKAGIAAEVLCQPRLAIGSGIYASKIYLEVPELFAWTAAVVILSMLLERLLHSLLESVQHRERYSEGAAKKA